MRSCRRFARSPARATGRNEGDGGAGKRHDDAAAGTTGVDACQKEGPEAARGRPESRGLHGSSGLWHRLPESENTRARGASDRRIPRPTTTHLLDQSVHLLVGDELLLRQSGDQAIVVRHGHARDAALRGSRVGMCVRRQTTNGFGLLLLLAPLVRGPGARSVSSFNVPIFFYCASLLRAWTRAILDPPRPGRTSSFETTKQLHRDCRAKHRARCTTYHTLR